MKLTKVENLALDVVLYIGGLCKDDELSIEVINEAKNMLIAFSKMNKQFKKKLIWDEAQRRQNEDKTS